MLELYDYVFFIFLILAVISVMRYQRIPGKYPILGILIGLSCYVIQDGFTGFMNSMSGIVMGLIISFFLYYLRALSLEDVILFVAMGSFLGFEDLLYTSMYTIDRKSTRLNSSHVSISYAVFCLKNKTI